ncbi:MAG TPA: CheR family methyltransferase [Gemmatimonadaceae bacterium]|nr:CheR family methyltransferase [Gemmatimonadaceae bacterium]
MASVSSIPRRSARSVQRVLRILWNTLTFSESARGYPRRARELASQWIFVRHRSSRFARVCGAYVQRWHCARERRRPGDEHTFFLRNRVQCEVVRDIALRWAATATFHVASIGCSTGAELYSALWMIRSACPDVGIEATGVDISARALAVARSGCYPRTGREVQRLSAAEIDELACRGLFEVDGETLVVQPWVAAGTRWVEGNVLDPSLLQRIGPQDVVIANNILCHFQDAEAEAGLRNIARLLLPGGHLLVQGIDLDVKTRVVKALGLEPVADRIEELYEGDAHALRRWPRSYWAPEPLDRGRRDWRIRYGTLFQRGPVAGSASPRCHRGAS